MSPRQKRLMTAAIHDDPHGWRHPIWTELRTDPIPPISAEERWLVDEAVRTDDWALVMIKVWDRDADGNFYKLWSLATGPYREAGSGA